MDWATLDWDRSSIVPSHIMLRLNNQVANGRPRYRLLGLEWTSPAKNPDACMGPSRTWHCFFFSDLQRLSVLQHAITRYALRNVLETTYKL